MTTFKGGRKSGTGARTGLGRSFGGLIRYLQQGHRDRPDLARVAWSSTRNLDTEDPAEAAQLMRYAASENPRVEEPVYHFGLSLAAGEHLTREQWEDAAGRVLRRMGLADHQAVLIAHRDTEKEHVHIVVNRIGDDGLAWRPFRDMVQAHEAIPAIEIEYDLSRTGREQAPPDLGAGAVREAMRTGVQPLADRVREEAGHVFAQATGWVELEAGLAELGYRLEPAERGSGLVVTDGSRRVSLSKVDRNLSGPKLAARFGETFREHRERHPEPPQVQRQAGAREREPLAGATRGERAAALIDRLTATRATFTEADVQRAAFHERDSHALAERALDRGETVSVGRDARGVTHYAAADYLRDEARLFHAAGELAARQDLASIPATSSAPSTARRGSPPSSATPSSPPPPATTSPSSSAAPAPARPPPPPPSPRPTARLATRCSAAPWPARPPTPCSARPASTPAPSTAGSTPGTAARSSTAAACWSSTRPAWWTPASSPACSTTRPASAPRSSCSAIPTSSSRSAPATPTGACSSSTPRPASKPSAARPSPGSVRRPRTSPAAGSRRPSTPTSRPAASTSPTPATPPAPTSSARYAADRAADPGRGQLVLAYRNDDVARLNTGIRDQRLAAGELGAGVTVAGADYAAGDRLVFLKNDHQGREVTNLGRAKGQAVGVKNGTLATLERVSPDRFVARLDDGRRVAFHPGQYDRIAHGYAVTIHKSQGATVDRTYVLADPLMNRNASYVALTRHREGVQVYTDRQTFADREHLDRALSRAPSKDLARDYAAAAIERQAARLAPLENQASNLRHEIQHVRWDLSIVEHAVTAARDLAADRANLV